jgi:hypothetical protein
MLSKNTKRPRSAWATSRGTASWPRSTGSSSSLASGLGPLLLGSGRSWGGSDRWPALGDCAKPRTVPCRGRPLRHARGRRPWYGARCVHCVHKPGEAGRARKKDFFSTSPDQRRPAVYTVGRERELFRGRLCTRGTRARAVSRPIVYTVDTNASCSAPVVYTGDTSVSCSAAGCVHGGHERELFRRRLCTRGTRA